MVLLKNWEEFITRSEALFREFPLKTRYTTKYCHKRGRLVLKVTNDAVCLTFKTEQATDLKRLDRLNAAFFTLAALGPSAPVVPLGDAVATSAAEGGRQAATPGVKREPPPAPTAGAGGGKRQAKGRRG